MNLPKALAEEIKRNVELLEIYNKIPTGSFGATMIKVDIEAGIDALVDGDPVKMMKVYEDLKDNE